MREILIAGAIALFLSLFGTPGLIRILARRGYGQIIRDDGPSSHHTKRGTPTMGGIIIIFASAAGYFIAHALTRNTISTSALLVLGLMASLGFVGFLDDWLKVSRQKSLGLNAKQKIFGQVLFAAIFGYLGIRFPDGDGLTPISQNLSTVREMAEWRFEHLNWLEKTEKEIFPLINQPIPAPGLPAIGQNSSKPSSPTQQAANQIAPQPASAPAAVPQASVR